MADRTRKSIGTELFGGGTETHDLEQLVAPVPSDENKS